MEVDLGNLRKVWQMHDLCDVSRSEDTDFHLVQSFLLSRYIPLELSLFSVEAAPSETDRPLLPDSVFPFACTDAINLIGKIICVRNNVKSTTMQALVLDGAWDPRDAYEPTALEREEQRANNSSDVW